MLLLDGSGSSTRREAGYLKFDCGACVTGLVGPSREASMLLPRLEGEVGPGRCEFGLAICDRAGDIDLGAGGEVGRANLEGLDTAGLVVVGGPPCLGRRDAGEEGRAIPEVRRDI